MYGRGGKTNTKLQLETLKGRYNLKDLGIYARIVLKWILNRT
jgi:hypothetical protein